MFVAVLCTLAIVPADGTYRMFLSSKEDEILGCATVWTELEGRTVGYFSWRL